jgi:membrane protease YdiL (CAAX protease family)
MLAIFASSVLGFIVTAILVFVWARHSNTPLRALGFRKPPHPAATLLAGLALGVTLKLALKSIAMPLLGAPAINQTYHYVVGNVAALPLLIATVLISAAFGEEVFFRGYLFERLGTLLGASRAALFATVLSPPDCSPWRITRSGTLGVEQAR